MLIDIRQFVLSCALLFCTGHLVAACAADEPPCSGKYAWQNLFDGRTLKNWRTSGFGGEGQVAVEKGMIVMESGADLTGITHDSQPPRTNYEIALEGMRIDGRDFFCTTTFPVGDEPCSLVVGGWGGGIVGLSNVDGRDASENITTQFVPLERNKWYRVRIRVSDARIECWLDDEQIIDVPRAGHTFGIRPEVERSKPLGIATWQTTGAIRDVRMRLLPPAGASGGARHDDCEGKPMRGAACCRGDGASRSSPPAWTFFLHSGDGGVRGVGKEMRT